MIGVDFSTLEKLTDYELLASVWHRKIIPKQPIYCRRTYKNSTQNAAQLANFFWGRGTLPPNTPLPSAPRYLCIWCSYGHLFVSKKALPECLCPNVLVICTVLVCGWIDTAYFCRLTFYMLFIMLLPTGYPENHPKTPFWKTF